MNDKKTSIKKRNWAFILYPDSAPSDWKDILAQSGLQCAISPLHDKDFNATGEAKKPHYHVIIVYNGPTSFNVVKGVCDSLNCPIPQALEQIRGYYRYLTHKDNPEKAQYSDNDITTINGFDISNFVERTSSETSAIIRQIYDYIIKNDIIEFHLLTDYAFLNNADWFDVLTNGYTLYFTAVIRSRRLDVKLIKQRMDNINIESIDLETGEIKQDK